MPTFYKEITFTLLAENVEKWSSALLERGALSITIEDAYANTKKEHLLFDEPGNTDPHHEKQWPLSHLSVLFKSSINHEDIILSIAKLFAIPKPSIISQNSIEDQDWVKLTQSQFKPISIGKKIIITPSWETEANTQDRPIKIILDPGLAFGTGNHPTTQLCIEWLECVIKPTDTVLDYGCGSGILSIVADFCGAKNVVGVDIEHDAITASQQNSKLNKRNIKFYSDVRCPDQLFDIIIANILPNPLKTLAPLLYKKLRKYGHIALSGILENQADSIIKTYEPFIKLNLWKKVGEWVLLNGTK